MVRLRWGFESPTRCPCVACCPLGAPGTKVNETLTFVPGGLTLVFMNTSVHHMTTYAADYLEAKRLARSLATRTGCDVAIRRVKVFGAATYAISSACKMDSDYALAEIVSAQNPI